MTQDYSNTIKLTVLCVLNEVELILFLKTINEKGLIEMTQREKTLRSTQHKYLQIEPCLSVLLILLYHLQFFEKEHFQENVINCQNIVYLL